MCEAPRADDPQLPAMVSAGPYRLRNVGGALVPESLAVLGALASGATTGEIRDHALVGALFPQRSRRTRARLWQAVHARYFSPGPPWILEDLCRAGGRGRHDATALGTLYLHFALHDRLSRDWILGPVWERWTAGRHRVTRSDVLADLAVLLADAGVRWTEGSRRKLATSLLSALRDFGVAKGVRVKHLVRPVLTPETSTHMLRLLIEMGVRGASLVEHPLWRLFLRTPDEIGREFVGLSLAGIIRFEGAGSTVVLETPWNEADLSEVRP